MVSGTSFYDSFYLQCYILDLTDLTFKHNQSDFCTQLFWLKIANWREIARYFKTCSLNMSLDKFLPAR